MVREIKLRYDAPMFVPPPEYKYGKTKRREKRAKQRKRD